MKNLSFLLITAFLFSVISSGVFAQIDESENVKERLIELFELSKEGDYTEAASYCVYRGPDESREWNDVYNIENEEEIKGVMGICNRIKGYLDESTDYTFEKYSTEEESEGVWYVWEVMFEREDKEPKKVYFCFLDINGEYAIGDID